MTCEKNKIYDLKCVFTFIESLECRKKVNAYAYHFSYMFNSVYKLRVRQIVENRRMINVTKRLECR